MTRPPALPILQVFFENPLGLKYLMGASAEADLPNAGPRNNCLRLVV